MIQVSLIPISDEQAKALQEALKKLQVRWLSEGDTVPGDLVVGVAVALKADPVHSLELS